jgi:polyisoprenyl-teichoic acid--peptidoglycan teichoic acid transferase
MKLPKLNLKYKQPTTLRSGFSKTSSSTSLKTFNSSRKLTLGVFLNDYKNILLIVIFSLFVFSVSAFISFKLLNGAMVKESRVAVGLTPTTEPTPLPELNKTFNILLLGYGGAGHSGGALTDVMMIASIDPEKKRITFISLPRDTWMELPAAVDKRERHKINAAYAIGVDHKKYPKKELQYQNEHGGGEMAKYAVTTITDLPIRFYAAVDFSGFEKAIDILGGVEVNVPVAFDDYFYPVKGLENLDCGKSAEEIASLSQKLSGFQLEKQFPCRYEHLRFEKGNVMMDGKTALKFVRSRHSDQHGGDFARSQRQQALLLGLREKVISMGFISKADDVFSQLGGVIKTDFDKNALSYILSTQGDISKYEIKMVNLSTNNVFKESKSFDGQYILIPKAGDSDWKEIKAFVAKELESE